MSLDLTPLGNAIARLRKAMEITARDPTQTLIRDGLVQRFAFTYEPAHKMLKRGLEVASASPEHYDRMSFADLIRSRTKPDCCSAPGHLGARTAPCARRPATPTTKPSRWKS